MTEETVKDRYFEWIYYILFDGKKKPSYRKLLRLLHSIEFDYLLPMDGNRADDGINLRYRFGYEKEIPDYIIATMLDVRPCSVLEMMAALALRCEETIMDDPELGNRLGKWFKDMLWSMGLDGMSDSYFHRGRSEKIIRKFLNREYDRNGQGGLFTIADPTRDMRSAEIWYQMMWYLDEEG